MTTDNVQRVRDFGVLALCEMFASQSFPAEIYKEEGTERS